MSILLVSSCIIASEDSQFLRRDAEGGFEPLDEVAYAVVAQRHGDVQNAFLAGLQQRQRVIEFQIVKIFKQR